MEKKGQFSVSSGLVMGLVFGVASLVIAVIIAFVIVSTLVDADLLKGSPVVVSQTTTNETGWFNLTTYTVAVEGSSTDNYVILQAWNFTSGIPIGAANYTISDAGVITNATNIQWNNTNFTYTYDSTGVSIEAASAGNLSTNFTAGVNKISEKIPTILLIAAIVLILSVLAILVMVWQKMKMGGGSL